MPGSPVSFFGAGTRGNGMIHRGGGTQTQVLLLRCEYSNQNGLIFQIPPRRPSAGGQKWMSLGPITRRSIRDYIHVSDLVAAPPAPGSSARAVRPFRVQGSSTADGTASTPRAACSPSSRINEE